MLLYEATSIKFEEVQEIVITIGINEPRLKIVEGVGMDIVQRVAVETEIVLPAICSTLLIKTEDYKHDAGLV